MYGDPIKRNFELNTSKTRLTSGSWIRTAYDSSKMDDDKKSSNRNCMKIFQKCLYFSILIFLLFILAIQISDCIKTYINFPTYVETKIVTQPKAIFPAMTICPVKDGYKKEVLLVRDQILEI